MYCTVGCLQAELTRDVEVECKDFFLGIALNKRNINGARVAAALPA